MNEYLIYIARGKQNEYHIIQFQLNKSVQTKHTYLSVYYKRKHTNLDGYSSVRDIMSTALNMLIKINKFNLENRLQL
jgi:hypothetical protein